MDSRRFHRRFQLLAHDPIWPDHDWRLGVVQRQQALGVLVAPPRDPAPDQPARMRVLESERVQQIGRCRWIELLPLAVGATQHCIYKFAGAESVPALGELDGLGDCGVGGHAAHVQ